MIVIANDDLHSFQNDICCWLWFASLTKTREVAENGIFTVRLTKISLLTADSDNVDVGTLCVGVDVSVGVDFVVEVHVGAGDGFDVDVDADVGICVDVG